MSTNVTKTKQKIVVVIEQWRHYINYTKKVSIWYHIILYPPSPNGRLFSLKVALCPLSRNVRLHFNKSNSLCPTPQNIRLSEICNIKSTSKKYDGLEKSSHYTVDKLKNEIPENCYSTNIDETTVSAAILPKKIPDQNVSARFVGLLSNKNYIVIKKQNYDL